MEIRLNEALRRFLEQKGPQDILLYQVPYHS